jgi:DNA-binding CsgD family transcriptional regulator
VEHGWAVGPPLDFGNLAFRFLKLCTTLRKCLWKLLFEDHSQFPSQIGNVDAMDSNNTQRRLLPPMAMSRKGDPMKEQSVRLGPREQQIVELLLQGCDNAEIASQLSMARRTVKAHFNRLFLRFGITGGIKRVKLATLLYRRQTCLQVNAMEHAYPVNANNESSSLSPKA